jgi:nickel-dependent lactate racemase
MRVALQYDTRLVELDLPPGRFECVEPPASPEAADLDGLLTTALTRPWDGPSLADFLRGKRRLLLVVSDATRRTGVEAILPLLARHVRAGRGSQPEIRIIVATGIHRDPTPTEVESLVPAGLFPDAEVVEHHADRQAEMEHFGRTSFGNEVWLNRWVRWADAILVCGGVGYHYFAGFSGGRKSLLPGLAWQASIKHNHNLVFQRDGSGRHPGAATARLEGNPVHLDMMEALAMAGPERIFCVNTLLNGEGRITDLVAGHPVTAHLEACRRYLATHSAVLPQLADVVVASAGGFPRDINMIQSHKAVEMARHALRPGGAMVILAGCREGLGHASFLPWFRFRTEEEFRRELVRDYVINGQTALALFEKACRYRICLVSELPPEQVRQMGLIPARDPAEALRQALDGAPAAWRGVVLPQAGVTLCRVEPPA